MSLSAKAPSASFEGGMLSKSRADPAALRSLRTERNDPAFARARRLRRANTDDLPILVNIDQYWRVGRWRSASGIGHIGDSADGVLGTRELAILVNIDQFIGARVNQRPRVNRCRTLDLAPARWNRGPALSRRGHRALTDLDRAYVDAMLRLPHPFGGDRFRRGD
jgi:hypothetical protein